MINPNVIILAQIQGSLFEYACDKKDCSSLIFIKQYMHSSIAKRVNNINFLYSCEDVPYLYEQLNNEKKITLGKNIYPKHIMYWIGYLYIIISFKYSMSPKQIYKFVKPKDLFYAYDAYHSLDIEDAASRVYESKINIDINNFQLFLSTR